MRYILRTCEGREAYAEYVQSQIPDLEICFDDVGGAMPNYIKSLGMAGSDAVINLEDDIILTKDFCRKVELACGSRKDSVIQFFSMRKNDLTIGSRWDSGWKYMMAQCTYLPAMISKQILEYSKSYDLIDHKSHPLDSMVAAFLKSQKRKYWIHCPSLVDHRVGISKINPSRPSTNRQSLTFQNGTFQQ